MKEPQPPKYPYTVPPDYILQIILIVFAAATFTAACQASFFIPPTTSIRILGIIISWVILFCLLLFINYYFIKIVVTEECITFSHKVWDKIEVYNRADIICWKEVYHEGGYNSPHSYDLYCFLTDGSYFKIRALGPDYLQLKHAITYGIPENKRKELPARGSFFQKLYTQ